MAHAAVVSLMNILDGILHHRRDSYPNLYGTIFSSDENRQIGSLYVKLSLLLDLLEKSSQRQSSEEAKSLEIKITDAVYHAEDVIESHIFGYDPSPIVSQEDVIESHIFGYDPSPIVSQSQRLRRKSKRRKIFSKLSRKRPARLLRKIFSKLSRKRRKIFSKLSRKRPARLLRKIFSKLSRKRPAPASNLSRKLPNIIGEIDSITEEMVKIKNGSGEHNPQRRTSLPSKPAPRGQTPMVGFDVDLMQIKDRLCNQQQSKLQIVPIVGMGGSGKTTLTMNVYGDSFVADHFYVRAWVTLSQHYSVREVLLGLLDEIVVLTHENRHESNEKLAEHLYKSLKRKRYLIVVDDIWSIKAWNEIKMFFPDDNNGSRIIFTTRLTDVADYANSFNTHHQMRFLDEEQSWNLFLDKVFGQENCPPELEVIGQQIAKNCHGLPLSIVVIGGLLSKENKTRDYWEHVAINLKSIVTENDERCSKILTLSYDHLPHHLKACFLYMGAFPEDYEVPVSKLIKLWVAEGFLKPHESKLLEEVAEEYLADLINRNLILVRKKGSNGTIKTCNMHDLLRELCIRMGQEEKFLYVKNVKSKALSANTIQQRRLSIHPNVVKDNDASYSFIEDIRETMQSISGARSLLLIGSYPIESENHCCFRFLRVLDMAETKLIWFPKVIQKLINLRYLAISCEADFDIGVLRNLQTLIVYSPPRHLLPRIGNGIWDLLQLRHLKLIGGFLPTVRSWRILKNLVTISATNFVCTEMFLNIPNLKKLGIYFTRDFGTAACWFYDESLNNLCGFSKLEKLKLSFQSPPNVTYLRHITFPLSLKKITLDSCRIPWEFLSIFTSSPNLEVLKLHYAFMGPEWVPTEGEFPKLKFLQIWGTNLVHWRAEDNHFPSLEHLVLRNCSKLEEIPASIGEIPTLETIKMDDSSPSAVDSAWQILDEQRNQGNDGLQLVVYPHKSEF